MMIPRLQHVVIILTLAGFDNTKAFTPMHYSYQVRSETALNFGIPTFGSNNEKKKDEDSKNEEEEKKIGFSGLMQLITAGMGSPFLGDFEGVDEETGNFMFSLEANNFADEVSSLDLVSN